MIVDEAKRYMSFAVSFQKQRLIFSGKCGRPMIKKIVVVTLFSS